MTPSWLTHSTDRERAVAHVTHVRAKLAKIISLDVFAIALNLGEFNQ
jgi:hypothetical protein